jgi:hypothetical protein
MKLATLITCLSLASHIHGTFYPCSENGYTALEYTITLKNEEHGRLYNPSKINCHFHEFRALGGASGLGLLDCIFSVKEGIVHINNPLSLYCYAFVLQDGTILESHSLDTRSNYFDPNHEGRNMGTLASTRSKETTIKVQYWVKRHELLRQIGPN